MVDARTRIGLAFQGGIIPAGALGAGVVSRLVEEGVFDSNGKYDVVAFSGTSSGALDASVCWAHTMLKTMDAAPDTLQQLWTDIAYGLIPTSEIADIYLWLDHVAGINPLYNRAKDKVVVPWMHRRFSNWVEPYFPIRELKAVLADPKDRALPHLVLGAAEVLDGTITYFHLGPADPPDGGGRETIDIGAKDLSLKPILASGSYADVNGFTTISEGPGQGIYCDGAWGTNPPLAPLIDCGVQEIWLVEAFPKTRETEPRTHAEREDRKEELWQNSLVEHELKMITKVNKWLLDGSLQSKKKHHIAVRRMPMRLNLPVGAKLVNSRSFIEQMIQYGHDEAGVFLDDSADAAALAI